MVTIPVHWRRVAARLVKVPLFNYLMVLAVRLVVPRHRIGVMLVALDEESRVLLLRHVFHPHTPWGLPGGWLNRGEPPAAGILREIKEEMGVTAVLHSTIHIAAQTRPPHIGIAYLGHIQPGPMTLSAEIIEARWFPPNEMPDPLSAFTKDAIKAAGGREVELVIE